MTKKSSTLSKPDFATYFREHGSILQTKYPFLTPSQIKGKARDIWKKLPYEEKPVPTPVKSKQRVKTTTPQKQKPSEKTKRAEEDDNSSVQSTPSSTASSQVKFQGIGEMGYTTGRKVPVSKPAPDVLHTHPTSITSILRSSEKNKAHNVSFTSPSQWISRSLTESPADTTQTTSQKNSGSEELFNDDARDDSSQELAYGIGSDDSDVDKSNQLNVLHTKALRSKKKTRKTPPRKTPTKKERTSAKKGTNKTERKKKRAKSAKKGTTASGKISRVSVQRNTLDRYAKATKESDIESEQNLDTHYDVPFLTGSQSTNNNTDDHDSDYDKVMMLAQLYVEKKSRKNGGRSRKKTPKGELSFEKADTSQGSQRSNTPAKEEEEEENDCISFGSPLLKLKKLQQYKYTADHCFGFDCSSPEPDIVSIVPLKDIQNMALRDAVVVVRDQVIRESDEDNLKIDETQTADGIKIDLSDVSLIGLDNAKSEPANKEPVNRRKSKRLAGEELLKRQENEENEKESNEVGNRGKKRRGKTSSDVFKTPNLPGLGVKDFKSKADNETSQLTANFVPIKAGKKGEDRTTTPLMPEALVQKTFQQAVASPRKRKRSPHPNQHDHHATTNSEGENARPTKCARKSLIDEKDELDENNSDSKLLSPFDKRKQGIPNMNRIRLTPRPKKQRESRVRSEEKTRHPRSSLAKDRTRRFSDTNAMMVQDSQDKERKIPTSRGNSAWKRPKQTVSPFDSAPSSLESGEELESFSTWKPPLLQAAATYQLAKKYKELDTFESIFNDDEFEETTAKTSGALIEAMKAMKEAANLAVEEMEETSDLTSSPSQLSAVSPPVSEMSDAPRSVNVKSTRGCGKNLGKGGSKQPSPACSGDLEDSGKDTAEEPDQGDFQPYMKQLQQNVEQSLMDMFDEPKPSTSINRRNLVSGYLRKEEEDEFSDQLDSDTDIFL